MGALTKAEMAERLYEELGLNKREAKELVELFFEEIRHALEDNEQVKLSGFGNFDLRDKRQRPGRCRLSRRSKLPKPDNLTCSLSSRACLISSKNSSTNSLASRLFRPNSS